MRHFAAAALLVLTGLVLTSAASAQDAAALREREAALREALAKSPFRRPLVMESGEANGAWKGDVYAVVGQPYDIVGRALSSMNHWCDILMLQFNVKDCSARGSGGAGNLSLGITRKHDDPSATLHYVDFNYRVVSAAASDYLAVQLAADAGPFGTRNYRTFLEAIPLDTKRTFLHLSYSYGYGAMASIAMKGYLATTGRNKIGFSVVGRRPDGTPLYVGGERGVIERNSMRTYLAIEAFLGAPATTQTEKRLNDWFTALEHYPWQLREMERGEYLAMKRKELARLQTASLITN